MKAFILAGGEGTRLRPYTYSVPKPMLKIGGKPILQYVIENLARSNIKDIVVTVGCMHEQISEYFGDGKKFGVKIDYFVEKEKMNTAGSIKAGESRIKETFAVVMGDHLTNVNMAKMFEHHKKSGAVATVGLYVSKTALEYGVAKVENEKIVGFVEKPLIENLFNTAIYIFEPEIFKYIKEKEDFAKDVIPRLLKEGKKVSPYIINEMWFDVGRVSDYEKLDEMFKMYRLAQDLNPQ